MVLSSNTIPPFHEMTILKQLIHVVMSCIALELLPPLHSFIMCVTLLFVLLYWILLYDVEPIQVLTIMKILSLLCYSLLYEMFTNSLDWWITFFSQKVIWVMDQSSTVQLSASEKTMCQYCLCCHEQQSIYDGKVTFSR